MTVGYLYTCKSLITLNILVWMGQDQVMTVGNAYNMTSVSSAMSAKSLIYNGWHVLCNVAGTDCDALS